VRESYQINVRYITREGQKRYTGSAEPFNPAQKPEVSAGKVPEAGDIAKGEVLLPEVYLEPLGFNSADAAIGKTVQITVQKPFSAAGIQAALQGGQPINPESLVPESKMVTFTVVGVTKKPATSLSFGILPLYINNVDAKELYTYTAQGTPDYQKYLWVYARVKDGNNQENINKAKKELESLGYFVQSSEDIQKTITQFVNILQILVGVFGIITLIASIFGIVNTQYISVLERTREIGLMKALGMSRRSVSRLFTIEATWIGFMGGLMGIVFGVALTYALNPVITDKLELGAGNSLLVNNWLQLGVLLVSLMLVATLAGLLPARKAAKLNPIEALRTE
jgi:putative ABC transport system permease protein